MVTEGKAKLDLKLERIVSKKMEVFYNPVMKFNRDISILLLNCLNKENMQLCLPLAGSGIRGIRFLKELNKGAVKLIAVNDLKPDFINTFKKILKLNKINSKKIHICNKDANLFLLESNGFDYIDIDPFGSPNFLLNNAIVRLSRGGVLAVTATDTSSLSGTYTNACKRKYWGVPLKTETMHETGLRILIRKVQLIGSQFDKALTPIFSYSKDHYLRVFFSCTKGKKKVDVIIKQHGYFKEAGPMFLGPLYDEKLASLMFKKNKVSENSKILEIIKNESKINSVGFFDITKLAKKYKIRALPKINDLIKKIKGENHKACITHFRENSIKTDISEKDIVKLIRSLI